MAIDTGLEMVGGILRLLPPNASPQDQTVAINNIIAKLNTWNGVVVKQGTADIVITASPINWATIPHGLGYQPIVEAYFNNVTIGSIGSGSLPFPTFGNASISGGNVNFTIWMFAFADETNVYLVALNGTGADQGTFVATYLLKRFNINQA